MINIGISERVSRMSLGGYMECPKQRLGPQMHMDRVTDGVVRKKWIFKKESPQQIKEVIYTQLREHVKQLLRNH